MTVGVGGPVPLRPIERLSSGKKVDSTFYAHVPKRVEERHFYNGNPSRGNVYKSQSKGSTGWCLINLTGLFLCPFINKLCGSESRWSRE